MRISDWSSDVCSSDLAAAGNCGSTEWRRAPAPAARSVPARCGPVSKRGCSDPRRSAHNGLPDSRSRSPQFSQSPQQDGFLSVEPVFGLVRSEEHTSELQSLMRISYAVSCLKKKQKKTT